ncbi:LD-carboxypeptidase [bacterium]|nr:LD-carboxypeptidase [candidate division CSSED10-310 bacterium]
MSGKTPREPVKPLRLRPGDRVCICAPAGPPDPDKLNRGIRTLRDAGFTVEVGTHCLDRQGYLAGPDDMRADDFNRAVRNPDIRAIFCARGGYGSARIVDAIDYDALRRDPKIIAGFSDITSILMAIWRRCRLISFHGPNAGGFRPDDWSTRRLFEQIMTPRSGFDWPLPPGHPRPTVIRSGMGSGRIIGGCLSILSTIAGTPDQLDLSEHILFVEEVGEAPYRIDRHLIHLQNAGWFDGLHGLLFGQFTRCLQRPEDPEPTIGVDDILARQFGNAPHPVVTGLPVGHGDHNFTIPIGCTVSVDGDTIRQEEPGVD